MGTKLTHASRIELADSLRRRYQSSSGKTKKRASTTMQHARRSLFYGKRQTGSAGSGFIRCCAFCYQLLSGTVT